ncbi:MAG: hypothetical protein O3A00_24415 [Planctomycetota bacterium]|nr:hypothetical protein [Planctomycetota bacterium]
MVRGKWIFAICGAVGIAFSVGLADDSLFQNNANTNQPELNFPDIRNNSVDETRATSPVPRVTRSTAEYFSRSGQTSSPNGTNFDASSFGNSPSFGRPSDDPIGRSAAPTVPNRYTRDGNPFESRTSTVPTSGLPTRSNVELLSSPRGQRQPIDNLNAGRIPFNTDRGSNAIPGITGSGIRQAEYERPNGTTGDRNIQRVGAASSELNPFESLPPIDSVPVNRPIPSVPIRTIPAIAPPTAETPEFGSPAFGSPAVSNTEVSIGSNRSMARIDAAATSGKLSPNVTLEWVKQGHINVGQSGECSLVVKNTGKVSVFDVEVDASVPAWVRITDADPKPFTTQDRLTWKLATLDPGDTATIKLSVVPEKRGKLTTSAYVRFTTAVAGSFDVEEPLLQVAVKGSKDVMVGEPASQIITLTNPGTGNTDNVTIKAQIPKGLKHVRGEELEMKVGSLGPGESRSVRLALVASEGGRHSLDIIATADGGLTKTMQATVNVIAPSLEVSVVGPGLRYLGRSATYSLNVINNGTVASNNVRAKYKVPDGFKFVSTDHGGKYDDKQQTVSWFVGRLEPGNATKFDVKVMAEKLGDFVHRAGAISEHGAIANAEANTKIAGTASLVLEIVDLDDPVEVGAETAYEIRIRNEGSKAALNVGITCELAKGSELVGAKGPSQHIADKGLLVFKSLKELGPDKTAIYRVQVRGVEAGNQRFRVRLMSDSIQEPLIFEELTKFYAE